MTAVSDRFARTVSRTLQRLGQDATLTRPGGVLDRATLEVTATAASETVRCSPGLSALNELNDVDLLPAGRREVWIDAATVSGVAPIVGDQLTVGAEVFMLTEISTIDVNGVVIAYKAMVRGKAAA